MANKQNYIWIGIAIIAVIVLVIVLVSNSNNSYNQQNNEPEKITISQDNFVFVGDSYLNSHLHQDYCEKRRTGENCRHTQNADPDSPIVEEPCPETDIFDIQYKVVNLDYTPWCKVYDGSQIVKTKIMDINGNFDHYQEEYSLGGDPGRITVFLDYMYPHELMLCCTVGTSDEGRSNEVCLPKIKVDTVC